MPLPETRKTAYPFETIKKEKLNIIGSPSPLTRYLGNPQQNLEALRAFLYYHMGLREPITELTAVWRWTKVEWIEQTVIPSGKYEQLFILMSAEELMNMCFPPNSAYRKRPPNVSDLDWNNHLCSLNGIICEIQ